jgi:hypothetical protein
MKPTDTHSEPPTQEEANTFLNDLRISGVTNMFGAGPYVQEYFKITKYDANRFLLKWMEAFHSHTGEGESQKRK